MVLTREESAQQYLSPWAEFSREKLGWHACEGTRDDAPALASPQKGLRAALEARGV
jgi:hypothetical protein